ncbi:hypothetical protein C482_15523 [Natrialba chahannaoensis JCM 10990]|uniref:Uncharacterized protein n=1 Tax=Natrialba chahannaoensis JCM 10990 TaxID=1227492 RepID=M0ADF8_9EURY|nr:hypothetical protein C482_15523 [Natrialba chahannaoensis JCM 10990]
MTTVGHHVTPEAISNTPAKVVATVLDAMSTSSRSNRGTFGVAGVDQCGGLTNSTVEPFGLGDTAVGAEL